MTVRTSATFRLILAAFAISCAGTGLVLPFTAIYLASVRDLGNGVAALFFGVVAASSFATAPVAGQFVDRWSARGVCLLGTFAQGAGYLSLAFVTTEAAAVVCAVVIGVGNGLFHSAFTPVLATQLNDDNRRRGFSHRYLAMNIGLGAGAAVAAFLVERTPDIGSFQLIYVLDAVSFVPLLAAVAVLAPRAERATGPAPMAGGGYGALLKTRGLLLLLVTQTLLVLVGYSQLDAVVPLVATQDMGVSAGLIGLTIAVNTVAVVVLQPTLGRLLEGRHAAGVLVSAGLTWIGANVVGLVATLAPQAAVPMLIIGFGIVFAAGEVCFGASYHALLTEVVPSGLLGRASALSSLSWNMGSMAGPAVGLLLAAALPATGYWAACAAGLILAAATAFVLWRRMAGATSKAVEQLGGEVAR
ncbi:MAG: MFS transporter [Dermatophilaceae bacterium]